jgi:hypothetical protein
MFTKADIKESVISYATTGDVRLVVLNHLVWFNGYA